MKDTYIKIKRQRYRFQKLRTDLLKQGSLLPDPMRQEFLNLKEQLGFF